MRAKKQFTLQQYSCLAGALLLIQNNSFSQAIYTDIEPDVELQFQGDFVYIDMDSDSNNDFFLLKRSSYFTNTYYEWYRFNHILKCGPNFNPENSIAGIFATNGAGGGTTYFPYAINAGEIINSDLSFQYGHYQLMGIGFFDVDETPWVWHYFIGSWTPSIDSMFLGVRFLGGDDCKHYGWIRCSTADSAKTLIVHDFAYESKCETPIIAGDTIGDTTTVAVSNLLELNAEIFVYNKQVFVSCKVSHQLEIFDSSGKKILDSNRQQGAYNIDMQPFPKGIYIVKLTSGSQMISKTISM